MTSLMKAKEANVAPVQWPGRQDVEMLLAPASKGAKEAVMMALAVQAREVVIAQVLIAPVVQGKEAQMVHVKDMPMSVEAKQVTMEVVNEAEEVEMALAQWCKQSRREWRCAANEVDGDNRVVEVASVW